MATTTAPGQWTGWLDGLVADNAARLAMLLDTWTELSLRTVEFTARTQREGVVLQRNALLSLSGMAARPGEAQATVEDDRAAPERIARLVSDAWSEWMTAWGIYAGALQQLADGSRGTVEAWNAALASAVERVSPAPAVDGRARPQAPRTGDGVPRAPRATALEPVTVTDPPA